MNVPFLPAQVTLMIPWLAKADQSKVFPNNTTFDTPEQQEEVSVKLCCGWCCGCVTVAAVPAGACSALHALISRFSNLRISDSPLYKLQHCSVTSSASSTATHWPTRRRICATG